MSFTITHTFLPAAEEVLEHLQREGTQENIPVLNLFDSPSLLNNLASLSVPGDRSDLGAADESGKLPGKKKKNYRRKKIDFSSALIKKFIWPPKKLSLRNVFLKNAIELGRFQVSLRKEGQACFPPSRLAWA